MKIAEIDMREYEIEHVLNEAVGYHDNNAKEDLRRVEIKKKGERWRIKRIYYKKRYRRIWFLSVRNNKIYIQNAVSQWVYFVLFSFVFSSALMGYYEVYEVDFSSLSGVIQTFANFAHVVLMMLGMTAVVSVILSIPLGLVVWFVIITQKEETEQIIKALFGDKLIKIRRETRAERKERRANKGW